MPWVSVLLRRRIAQREGDIHRFTDEDVTDEDVGFCKGVGMWHLVLQLVQEKLKISQMRQKSYATVPFFPDLCNTYLELSAVMPVQCCLNRIEPYIMEFFSLPWPYQSVFPLCPSSDGSGTKRPWRPCNGWWCSCNSFREAADNGTRSVLANNIPHEEWWESLPVLPILWHSLSSSSCDWRWSHD